jgi:carboxypeptidase C (cathepsin A)
MRLAKSLSAVLMFVLLVPAAPSQETRNAAQPAASATDQHKEAEKETIPVPPEKPVVTHHDLTLSGKTLKYSATAGNLIIRDEDDKPYGNIF